ncbi:MAG: hypothetical protein HC865_06030 [Cyanobacteria bacterium RU_5_0]|nr:hypothetical protein [Cyanobacteria bacterium RU_5_0]
MSQVQLKTYTSQPSTTTKPIDPAWLLEYNTPASIILSVAFLLWVLRPVMLQNSGSSKKK